MISGIIDEPDEWALATLPEKRMISGLFIGVSSQRPPEGRMTSDYEDLDKAIRSAVSL